MFSINVMRFGMMRVAFECWAHQYIQNHPLEDFVNLLEHRHYNNDQFNITLDFEYTFIISVRSSKDLSYAFFGGTDNSLKQHRIVDRMLEEVVDEYIKIAKAKIESRKERGEESDDN